MVSIENVCAGSVLSIFVGVADEYIMEVAIVVVVGAAAVVQVYVVVVILLLALHCMLFVLFAGVILSQFVQTKIF